ncbi:DUF3574 domain-containing protein [Streptomyces roseoverticillatus]|uniref:DUF3574 domain-containing protein n=1 Tax=Streptomyces roseoverticillatus TaxID=66429 RepID=UPI001F1C8B4C|nr:DUF3574 domain-containing protein [Streptomyces roseoverticillatus]MCF3105978.1 DUF3574 domain-containing protein [Streptomyces roseoverticillatus]
MRSQSSRCKLTLLLATAAAVVTLTGADTARTPPAGHEQAEQRSTHTQPYVETQLFFGTGRHNNAPPVSSQQFMDFVREQITPRFPSGLTLYEGHGQWRDHTASINSERSYVLIVLYPQSEARSKDADIEHIREKYKDLYELESVGRADMEVTASF